MKYASLIALSAALGLAAPGLALAESCSPPAAPAAIDGATASLQDVIAAKTSVTDFMSASDDYQKCVLDDLQAQRTAATQAKTKLDPAISKAAEAKVSQNQADKERVGAAFNAAVKAFKAAHPS
jgi:hypothetical protein